MRGYDYCPHCHSEDRACLLPSRSIICLDCGRIERNRIMIIELTCDITFLGTDIKISRGWQYEAKHATNQPNWQEEGKIFVKYGFGEDDWTPCIDARDYVIISLP